MDSIAQITDILNSFSKSNFKFTQFIEFFNLIKEIPSSISYRLNNIEFITHLEQAKLHIEWLCNYFDDYINPELRKNYKKLAKTKPKKESMVPYADFSVDNKKPIFDTKKPEQMSFNDLIKQSLEQGKEIKPVKRRNNKLIAYKGLCPSCGAPDDYIYDNNGKGTQFKCKVCSSTFALKKTSSDGIGIYCPYCGYKLDLHHDRNGYLVLRCPNYKCPNYLHNSKLVKEGKGEHLKTSSGEYLLHYHYRDFKFNLKDLAMPDNNIKTKVNLSNIANHPKTLGLVLTYYVDYGLSSRKTSLILWEVHGIKISHQTVLNYAEAVAAHVKAFVDNYPYKLRSLLSGDETYIKIRGKNHYVFFFSDPVTKVITSYTIYGTRNTFDACKAIHDSLSHYDTIPDDMTIITDGNPIYNAAQLFFHINGIDFDLHQVIGVKNLDEESKKYRPYKQIEERLNRTYKQNYYGTNGYDSLDGANTYMILYVAFFNFLRKHSSLGYKTPVNDGLFNENMRIYDKWLKLIDLSNQYNMN